MRPVDDTFGDVAAGDVLDEVLETPTGQIPIRDVAVSAISALDRDLADIDTQLAMLLERRRALAYTIRLISLYVCGRADIDTAGEDRVGDNDLTTSVFRRRLGRAHGTLIAAAIRRMCRWPVGPGSTASSQQPGKREERCGRLGARNDAGQVPSNRCAGRYTRSLIATPAMISIELLFDLSIRAGTVTGCPASSSPASRPATPTVRNTRGPY